MTDHTQGDTPSLDRRGFLQMAGAGLVATGVAAAVTADAQAANVDFVSTMDFKDPKWNRDAYARLQGDLDTSKTKVGWYGGVVLGVEPNARVRELVGFEGFSVCRLKQLEDGSWRKLLREVVYYRDPQTGALLDEWKNPWTGEVTRVVDVTNDPFNYTIGEYYPDPPSFGGQNKEKPPKVSMLLPWRKVDDETLYLTTDIHLYYPNLLNPAQWPRESSGPMIQASEMFRYVIPLQDMLDPTKTTVGYHGTWNRITPWLPWMLLGQRPGHLLEGGFILHIIVINTMYEAGFQWNRNCRIDLTAFGVGGAVGQHFDQGNFYNAILRDIRPGGFQVKYD